MPVKIPDVFKEYLQSYALPITSLYGNIKSEDLSRFTYCEEDNRVRDLEDEEEIATTQLELNPMMLNYELHVFKENTSSFKNTGYICIGGYNDYYYVLLDAESGRIVLVDHEETISSKEDIKECEDFFFNSFEDLVRCYFGRELYDRQERKFIEE